MTTALVETQEQPLRAIGARSSRRAGISRLFRAPWIALLAITLFAGILRFSFLDRPAIWSDEAMTHARICGSYQDLLDVLQFNGFVPLHYER